MTSRESSVTARRFRSKPRWVWLIGLALLVLLPSVVPERFVQLAILVGINVLLAQSLNLLTGYAGEMSIGHAALFGASA